MYSSKGGQRRTIETTCGWTTKCHPREANGKYKIHIRHCSICVEQDLPEYNRKSAKLNGWKGLMPNGDKPTTMRTSVVIEGVRNDLVVEATNMEDAMVNTKLTSKILQKIDDDEEKFELVEKITNLELIAPCPVVSDKYSGCDLGDMPIEKLKVILKLVEKQIADFGK
jgi:hypothetical protein